MHDVLKWRVSNHKKIDVARRAELAPCRGSEHERNLDATAKRREALPESIDEAGCFGEETPQFREDRRIGVGLEIHLTALHGPPHQPCGRQQFQFALSGADCSPRLADDLPEIVGLVRVAEQPAEQAAAGAAKKDHGGVDAWTACVCSQDGNERTQGGNVSQALSTIAPRGAEHSVPSSLRRGPRLHGGLEGVEIRLGETEVHTTRPAVRNLIHLELPVPGEAEVARSVLPAEARDGVIGMVRRDGLWLADR